MFPILSHAVRLGELQFLCSSKTSADFFYLCNTCGWTRRVGFLGAVSRYLLVLGAANRFWIVEWCGLVDAETGELRYPSRQPQGVRVSRPKPHAARDNSLTIGLSESIGFPGPWSTLPVGLASSLGLSSHITYDFWCCYVNFGCWLFLLPR